MSHLVSLRLKIGKFRVIIISHVSEDDTVFYIGPSSGSLSSERVKIVTGCTDQVTIATEPKLALKY